MKINFNKKANCFESLICEVFETAIDYLQPKHKELEVAVIMTTQRQIKKINTVFRGVKKVTDVLSFPLLTDAKKLLTKSAENYSFAPCDCNLETGNLLLGDIYISVKKAKTQAKAFGHSLNREVAYLALHGLLHLFGYDHVQNDDKKAMRKVEEEVLSRVHLLRDDYPETKLSIG